MPDTILDSEKDNNKVEKLVQISFLMLVMSLKRSWP
jgi:hypothetical protein